MPDASSPIPRFADPNALIKTINLKYPIQFGEKTYAAVCLRKISVRDLKAAVERADEERKTNPDASPRLPIYFAEDGEPLPSEVLESLEIDDFDTIDEAASGFLARRFRQSATTETIDQTSQDGTTTADSSSIPPSGATTEASSSA